MNIYGPIIQGFGLSIGLIIAIGAQNSFVLRQGLLRKHVFVTALISSLGDVILILIGISGVGSIIADNKLLINIALWGGAIFLFYYGIRSLKSALTENTLSKDRNPEISTTQKQAVTAAFAFSLLNPHAILDTVVLIGSVSSQYLGINKMLFGIGASFASVVWFFGLAYGAVWLNPMMEKPQAEKILDIIIGVIMISIGYSLIEKAL